MTNLETVCAGSTCNVADCCNPNPTCSTFQQESCAADHVVAKANLSSIVCASETCGSEDCCTRVANCSSVVTTAAAAASFCVEGIGEIDIKAANVSCASTTCTQEEDGTKCCKLIESDVEALKKTSSKTPSSEAEESEFVFDSLNSAEMRRPVMGGVAVVVVGVVLGLMGLS